LSVLEALESSGLAHQIRTSEWIYPTLQSGHLLAMAAAVGTGLVLDARLLGWNRLPLRPLLRFTQPILLGAAALSVGTGPLTFAADATDLARHPAFQAKMVLLGLLLGNALGFHFGARRNLGVWADAPTPPPEARLAGGLALVGWAGVITSARLIAFV
jgi:hypothetical protein